MINIQEILENDRVKLIPLQSADLEELYLTASDPAIWAQHPNKERWKKPIFEGFFRGAMESLGAYKILDKESGSIIGSTRYYNYSEADDSIFIGYTFYATARWGTGVNKSVKTLMLDYIFDLVSTVYFHIGASNVRSQMAITRIGAEKIGEEEVAYVNEPTRLNYVYRITREQWRFKQ